MYNLPEILKLDNNNLLYLDSKEIEKIPIVFQDCRYNSDINRRFYLVKGIENYMIKYTSLTPLFFNETRIKTMLRNFYNVKDNIPEIDIPIGYYKEDKLKGLIVPYYSNAISIRNFMHQHKLDNLKKYYNHDNNDIDNLIILYLEILHLIKRMYEENIAYMDIHSGNFVLYDNHVKVIDYEPGYVKFTNYPQRYYEKIICGYTRLINNISFNLGLQKFLLFPDDDFEKTREKVKELIKKIER